MKNVRKSVLVFAAVLLVSWGVHAQSVDMERMNRDIEIAENILSTLSAGHKAGDGLYFGDRVEGSYLEGYGVIFSIPTNVFFLREGRGNVAFVAPSSGYSYTVRSSEDNSSEVEVEDVEKARVKREKWQEESAAKMEEAMKTFLVDYADLIGQLQPTDKIMITTKSKPFAVLWDGNETRKHAGSNQMAEIKKSDLIDYKQGKLSREQAMAKVVITNKEVDAERDRDLEIFAGIFSRLYEPDFSTTYYAMGHTLNYERIDGLGVIFNLKVYSSNSDAGLHTIRTTGESGLSQEERNKKVEAMYPEFEKSLKENIVDYGRTIRSLKPTDMLLFKVELTECKGCSMPKAIEVSVKADVLFDYNSGKLSKEKALGQVKVMKN